MTAAFDSSISKEETPMPTFLGWDRPWLHLLVDYLFDQKSKETTAQNRPLSKLAADFSGTLIILPGSRAGRRLLELLAIKADEESFLLIPPSIVTLREAVPLLLDLSNKEIFPEADAVTSHLAWREAVKKLSPKALADIQSFPSTLNDEERKHASNRIATIAEKISRELGSINLDIQDVARRIGGLHPEFADREEARWEALAELQHHYRTLLQDWKQSDATDTLRTYINHGCTNESLQVITCALVDYTPLFETFLKKINPTILIPAPESHATGFNCYGKLLASYWLQHPASIEDNQIVPCERREDQAAEVLQKIISYQQQHKKENLANLIAIATPDAEALPVLREKLAAANIKSRWAGGRRFFGGRFFQLLQATADFINHREHQDPSLSSVATLLRHPDISTHFSHTENLIKELDAFERNHLPQFLEQERIPFFRKETPLLTLLPHLERLIDLPLHEEPLSRCLERLRAFLLRVIGKKIIHPEHSADRYFAGCLEKWLELQEKMELLTTNTKLHLRCADLIKLMLELLSKEEIPEREEPDAIELLGWLELAADDTPAVMITSFHEGAIPRMTAEDPLLNEGLRRALGLTCKNDLLARDHYLLQTILSSRRKGGAVTLFAPRYNGRNEPVRPSRLLLLGCGDRKLPTRILSLTQRHPSFSQQQKKSAPASSQASFEGRPIDHQLIEKIPVTAFRTYLQSPRLFYLKHLLKLQEVDETSMEMDAAMFGTLIHSALAAFGSEKKIAQETDVKKITSWLHQQLEEVTSRQFGKHPHFPVWSQIDEIARSLAGFATAQATHREAGWSIIATEERTPLEEKWILDDQRSLIIHGRIDRVDWNDTQQRWCIIDYKTSSRRDWESSTPNKEHFKKRGDTLIWHDLQLPLYLKLVQHVASVKNSGLPLPTIENSDLCYFQLPLDPERASISEPFDNTMIHLAWKETDRLAEKILAHDFDEIGNIDFESSTFAALCGVLGNG